MNIFPIAGSLIPFDFPLEGKKLGTSLEKDFIELIEKAEPQARKKELPKEIFLVEINREIIKPAQKMEDFQIAQPTDKKNLPEDLPQKDLLNLKTKPDDKIITEKNVDKLIPENLEPGEIFFFQRNLNKLPLEKKEISQVASKVVNVEKKGKKSDETSVKQNIFQIPNHDKDLNKIIKNNPSPSPNLKFSTPKELFNWISKIISKSQIKNGETLNIQIRDRNLGEFNISAQNSPKSGEIDMAIVSQNQESEDFFRDNEKELVQSLEQAGVRLGKIELLTTQNIAVEGEFTQLDGGGFTENINDHFSQRDQLNRDGQRRKQIWSRFQELKE